MIPLLLQARMTSKRFPGKVMANLNGTPLLSHVIKQCRKVSNCSDIIVCTSMEESDDIIYRYCADRNIKVFRGSLENVYQRFFDCLDEFNLGRFGRVCCDSPFISPELIELAIDQYLKIENVDLVSNVCERSFPIGQSIEIVRSECFKSREYADRKGFSSEHITQAFYNNKSHYNILNIKNFKRESEASWAIDTVDDLRNVEKWNDYNYSFNEANVICAKWE